MPSLRVLSAVSARPLRALALGALGGLGLLCLQACAATEARDSEPDGPVVGTYLDPLVRGGILEAPKDGSAAVTGALDGSAAAEGPRLEDLAPGYRPPADGDEAALWQSADELEAELRASGSVIDDPELTGYMKEVVCRLAASHCADIRVYVVSGGGFTASMSPNGMMEIGTGALLRLRSEAELAAVIGHELGHYLRRHSLQGLRSAKAELADFVASREDFDTFRLRLRTLLLEITRFSRFHEREADGYALRLLAEANYAPSAVARLWRRMSKEFHASEEVRRESVFFSSHPLMKERSEVLSVLALEVRTWMGATPVVGRDSYLRRTGARRLDFLRAELTAWEFPQMRTALEGLLADDDPNPAELHYFIGETYRLGNEDEDLVRALESYEMARKAEGEAPPELHRSRGLLLRQMGDLPAAAAAFRQYLDALPDARDRALTEDLLRRLEAS